MAARRSAGQMGKANVHLLRGVYVNVVEKARPLGSTFPGLEYVAFLSKEPPRTRHIASLGLSNN